MSIKKSPKRRIFEQDDADLDPNTYSDQQSTATQPVEPQGNAPQQPAKPKARPNTADVSPVTKAPFNIDYGPKLRMFQYIAGNMLKPNTTKRILWGGDTGISKTSFVKEITNILGLPVVIMEVPHTLEEHIIDIPFVVETPNGQKTYSSEKIELVDTDGDGVDDQGKQYEVELARSHLISELDKLTHVPDNQFAAHIASLPQSTQDYFQAIEKHFPGKIDLIRSRYQRILFLDEFSRKTSNAIRNSLRAILNGRLGNQELPQGTYTTYATNLYDKGIDRAASKHATFNLIKYQAPTVNIWLNNVISTLNRSGQPLKKDVLDAFVINLKDEVLQRQRGEDRGADEMRVSPRRWSDIIAKINAIYPFEDEKTVSNLETVLMMQLENKEKDVPEELTDVRDLLKNIIKTLSAKSGINYSKVRRVANTNWRELVVNEIMLQDKIGKDKKYVPVISGEPGIGKTQIGKMFEQEPYNMRFLSLDCPEFSADSVTGLPVSKMGPHGRETQFSKPELLSRILADMQQATRDYGDRLQRLEAQGELGGRTAREVFDEWWNKPPRPDGTPGYRFVLFFDEINRVKTVTVFNAFRRLILEKEFNHQFRLPDDILCLGAMNPEDAGVIQMTQHFKDAVDVIHAEPDWNATINFLEMRAQNLREEFSDDAVDTSINVIKSFGDSMGLEEQDTKKKKSNALQKQFRITVGDGDAELYFNPRDYDNLFEDLVVQIDMTMDQLRSRLDQGEHLEQTEIVEEITDIALDMFRQHLDWYQYTKSMEASENFWQLLAKIIRDQVSFKFVENIAQPVGGFGEIINKYIKELSSNSSAKPLARNEDFYDYMSNTTRAEFDEDFYAFVNNQVKPFLDEGGRRIDYPECKDFFFSNNVGSFEWIIQTMHDAIEQARLERDNYLPMSRTISIILDRAMEAFANEWDSDNAEINLDKIAKEMSNQYIKLMDILS